VGVGAPLVRLDGLRLDGPLLRRVAFWSLLVYSFSPQGWFLSM